MSSSLCDSPSAVLMLDLSANQHKPLILRAVRAGGQSNQLVTVLGFHPCIVQGGPGNLCQIFLKIGLLAYVGVFIVRKAALSLCVHPGVEGSKHFISALFAYV